MTPLQRIVLIVDDDRGGRAALEGMLLAEDYQLAFAENGMQAIEQASALLPDIILLDVMMPDIDGYEVCRQLRGMPNLAEVPIIMVTALDDRQSRLEGIAAGADDFISKPFERVELRTRVRTITRLNRYRRLLNERARVAWVIDHATDGYLILDNNGCINYINAQARLYLALEPEAPLPATPFLALAQARYQCEPAELWADFPTDPPTDEPLLRYLVQPEAYNQAALWLQVDSLPIPGDDQAEVLVCLRDVSEQIAMQRDTWAFHSVVAHKLRTPMGGLMVGLEMLNMRSDSIDDEEVQEMTTIALRSARRLHQSLESILRYVKITRHATIGTPASVAELSALIESLRTELPLADVQQQGETELAEVYAQLPIHTVELIMRELFTNAVKFHPQQRPTIQVCFGQADAYLRIEIGDDGRSLNQAQLARLWLPYRQGEQSFTGEVPGMGLGLPMIAVMLWQVGGSYRMANRSPGPGVVVTLDVPVATIDEL